jgi:hypothetical protein
MTQQSKTCAKKTVIISNDLTADPCFGIGRLIMIGPSGLLLLVSHLFSQVSVLVLWVGLVKKTKNKKLGCSLFLQKGFFNIKWVALTNRILVCISR